MLDESVHESEAERIRRFIEGTPPKPVERWIECWLPPGLADNEEPTSPGLVPISRTMTHGERCLLLAAVHRKCGVDVSGTLDPDKVSFLYTDGQGQGHGHYAILVHMVEDLADADVPVLMRMIEKVRKEFTKRNTGTSTADHVVSKSKQTEPPWQEKAQAYLNNHGGERNTWNKRITTHELGRAAEVVAGTISRWQPYRDYKTQLEKTRQTSNPKVKERPLTTQMLEARPAPTAEPSADERLDELLAEVNDATPNRQREIAEHCVAVFRNGGEMADVLGKRIAGDTPLQELIGDIDPAVWPVAETAPTG